MFTNSQPRITKRVMFCAAHHLPGAGKCENVHGHNWVAEIDVTLLSGDLDPRGFIVDVADLKKAAFKYDHNDLNIFFDYPSTEVVAQKIADDALGICRFNNDKNVYAVVVHLIETENNSAYGQASNFTWTEPTAITKAEALAQEAAYTPSNLDPRVIPATPTVSKFIKRQAA